MELRMVRAEAGPVAVVLPGVRELGTVSEEVGPVPGVMATEGVAVLRPVSGGAHLKKADATQRAKALASRQRTAPRALS